MVRRDKWLNQFSEWYQYIIENAGIIDYRYPIKGCGVWLPYGFKIRKNVISIICKFLDETGHEEVLFPLMITSEMIGKESEHIRSFENQVFWVTHAGGRELNEKLALRPTSETAIAPMLKLWIRSHADLPKKIYQVVSVFRYETKATRPLIRMREITTFKEAHTFHESFEDAERQINEAVEIYKKFFDNLGIPYLISRRPDWDKFAGASYSIAFDTILPDGRTLQIGTIHNLNQNFSKAFEITFEKMDGTRDYAWQTCYGISERVIASLIAIHGDDHGLVLPPKIAPIQVVVIPIPYKGYEEDVNRKCVDISKQLKDVNIRVVEDFREKLTPGSKFFEWELKGIPVRVEIGPQDVKNKTVTLTRRDLLEKKVVKDDTLIENVLKMFNDIEENLRKRALEFQLNRIYRVRDVEEIVKMLNNGVFVFEAGWCGKDRCGLMLEEKTNLNVLGVPVDKNFDDKNEERCIICQEKAELIIRLAKSY
ncbi:MAG: proline--tRNA ligase [Candidatus Bathyarchaeota archaeon]